MLSSRKYPTINPDPSADDCFKSMRVSDFLQWGGVTGVGWAYGVLYGKPLRFITAGICATSAFTFGGFLIYQNTRYRLLGLRENEREQQLYTEKKAENPQ